MANQIEVDDDVFSYLQDHAIPFNDTPNTVLRRLLEIDGANRSPIRAVSSRDAAIRTQGSKTRQARKGGPDSPTRAPSGSLLPEREYELPLLLSLIDLGGSAPYREVVDAVGKRLEDRFTELDRESLRSGGIRWKSRLQFVRLRLIERGLLDRDAPRGLWAITQSGKEFAAENGDNNGV